MPEAFEILDKEEDDLIKRIEQIISEMNVLQDKIIMISELIEGNKNKKFWETWKPAFIILFVVLLCILIWGTSLKY